MSRSSPLRDPDTVVRLSATAVAVIGPLALEVAGRPLSAGLTSGLFLFVGGMWTAWAQKRSAREPEPGPPPERDPPPP